jgi:hypothetical protein
MAYLTSPRAAYATWGGIGAPGQAILLVIGLSLASVPSATPLVGTLCPRALMRRCREVLRISPPTDQGIFFAIRAQAGAWGA